jgi:hypothetical protein
VVAKQSSASNLVSLSISVAKHLATAPAAQVVVVILLLFLTALYKA